MFPFANACCVLAVVIPVAASAQQTNAPAHSLARSTTFDVSVTSAKGAPVTALTAQDFKLLDSKAERTITTVKEVTAGDAPLQAILVIDAVNVPYIRLAYERSEVEKFLKANGGRLAQPTTVAVVMDKGAQISKDFSKDGNALSASLTQFDIGLREIRRNSGFWGADERVEISLTALQQILAYCARLPGRKAVLWISPGWPLLSGPRIELNAKQQDQIFGDVVSYSRTMQQANVVLYNINPLGPEENLFRTDYYQSFLKGVSKPSQADVADLSLQVLAAQSGGLVLNGNNNVAGNLAKFVSDARSWYEVTFDTAVPEHANEYHPIQVEVNKPGVTARTRDGYYAQP